jgi:cell division protein FtsB
MNTRYRRTKYQITEKEAKRQRQEELKHLREEIKDLKSQIKGIREAPLSLTRWKFETVNPGEPGYEDAILEDAFVFRPEPTESVWNTLIPK